MKTLTPLLMATLIFGTPTVGPTQAMPDIPVMDLHTDILNRAMNYNIDLVEGAPWAQATIPNLEKGNVTEQVFAVWVDSRHLQGLEATERALRMIDLAYVQAEKHSDRMALALSMADARAIRDSDRIAVFLWLEGGGPINDDLALLRNFHRLGIRGMTLTWMNNLSWAGASTDRDEPNKGLNEFGREVVREMNRLGLIVDLSHVSDQTFFDALEVTTDPVVVSHSNCRALADHPRNISDEMLVALAANGGVIGMNVLPSYLRTGFDPIWEETEEEVGEEIEKLKEELDEKTPEYREARRILIQQNIPEDARVTIETFLDHIDHAIAVAGPEHVALGSDYDGIWAFPDGLERPTMFPVLAKLLRARGHSEKVVRGVMGENARRVFEEVIDK